MATFNLSTPRQLNNLIEFRQTVPVFRRHWPSVYGAIQEGQQDRQRLSRCWLEHPLPGGYSPTGETGWLARSDPYGIILLVDPNNKTVTSIDGNGLKALTSGCHMVPVSV